MKNVVFQQLVEQISVFPKKEIKKKNVQQISRYIACFHSTKRDELKTAATCKTYTVTHNWNVLT